MFCNSDVSANFSTDASSMMAYLNCKAVAFSILKLVSTTSMGGAYIILVPFFVAIVFLGVGALPVFIAIPSINSIFLSFFFAVVVFLPAEVSRADNRCRLLQLVN